MQNVTHRFSAYLKYKDMSVPQAERLIGAGNGTLTKAIKGGRSISSEWLEKISDNFPDLDMNWLIRNSGQMLIGKGYAENDTPPIAAAENATQPANAWKEKYYEVLEKYTRCLEQTTPQTGLQGSGKKTVHGLPASSGVA